jgi:hypothetical protein
LFHHISWMPFMQLNFPASSLEEKLIAWCYLWQILCKVRFWPTSGFRPGNFPTTTYRMEIADKCRSVLAYTVLGTHVIGSWEWQQWQNGVCKVPLIFAGFDAWHVLELGAFSLTAHVCDQQQILPWTEATWTIFWGILSVEILSLLLLLQCATFWGPATWSQI